MTRKYSSISVETTLAAGINSTQTTMTVPSSTAATLLLGGQTLAAGNVDTFTVALSPDTVNEEIVYVTGVNGDTLTISRGQAGTGTPGVSGIAHGAGVTVKHVFTGDDATFFTAGVATANGAIQKSLVTTKGDLVTATTNATPARLGVGSNGQVLMADSSTATGLKWASTNTGWSLLTSGSVTSGSSLVISGLSSYNRIMISLRGITLSNNSSYLNYWANSKTELFKGTRLQISDNPPSGTSISQIETTAWSSDYFLGNGAVPNSGITITIDDNLTSTGKKVESKQVGNYGTVNPPIYSLTFGDTILDTSGAVSSVTIALEFGTATFTGGTYTVWGSAS